MANITRLAIILLLSAPFISVQLFAQNTASNTGPQVVEGEYIVKIKQRSGLSKMQAQSLGLKKFQKMGVGVQVKNAFAGTNLVHIKASRSNADQLANDPEVEYIEPNYILSIDPVSVNPDQVEATGVPPSSSDSYRQSTAPVKVKEAWGIAKPFNSAVDKKLIVAVVDTGLDLQHPVFKDSNSIWTNEKELYGIPGVDDDGNGYVDDFYGWNFVSNNGYPQDDSSHGTHVSGIVLGVTQDILVTPVRESRIQIMPLKFLNSSGSGTTAAAVNAIYYAIANGAQVINNSWGGGSYSRSLHEAYTYANTRNVIILTAAGNDRSNNDVRAVYPANLDTPNNLTIAATLNDDRKADFSNFGNSVSIAAPGNYITSTLPASVLDNGCTSSNCKGLMSGTSMAAPFVAGLAAMVLREAPQLTPHQVKGVITGSGDVVSVLNGLVFTSSRVNAYKAVANAKSKSTEPAWSPNYSPSYKASRDIASDSAAAGAASCGLVKSIDGGSSGDGGGMGTSVVNTIVIVLLSMVPIVVAFRLRNKKSKEAEAGYKRRQFARYNLNKELVIKIGDQVVEAASDTISIGGLSFSGNLDINKGQKISVSINGVEQSIEGEVVWCSQEHRYGVKFLNITDQLRTAMKMWTMNLTPT